ncbi:peptidylprolyl isomerase [Methylacidimicrobium sp. AP8]|uniref:peptidylprolyl isomerase n=1 Tax=Methylacidimicrobium sp. AP8 TaxID=2730359 RepID=UPI001924A991|nr:peptidylprolyl isomerase [Methylacidimicrobium sp. AP8]
MASEPSIARRIRSRACAWALFLAAGPGLLLAAEEPAADPVVASVNGVEIRRSEVEKALAGLGPGSGGPEAERNVLNALVQEELLVQEAYRQELEKSAEVKAAVAEATRKILVNAALKHHLERRKWTEEELRRRYAQAAALVPPREYRLRHIVVGTRREAAMLLDWLRQGANFSILARGSLEKATAERGGEIGWQNARTLSSSLLALVERLKPGQIGGPILSSGGWEVIQLLEARPAKVPTFEEAKASLEQQLQQESAQQLVQQLAAGARIEVFLPPVQAEPVAAAR